MANMCGIFVEPGTDSVANKTLEHSSQQPPLKPQVVQVANRPDQHDSHKSQGEAGFFLRDPFCAGAKRIQG